MSEAASPVEEPGGIRIRAAVIAASTKGDLDKGEEERINASSSNLASTEVPTIAQLFRANYASIWRLLRRLGVPQAHLDDAAQEVFWIAARRLTDIIPGSEHAFLYGIALRIASNHQRKAKAIPDAMDIDAAWDLATDFPSPDVLLEKQRARELLDHALARLPLELRSVFVFVELEGMAVKDVAELEGIALGTAASRLRRAREEFAEAIKRLRAAWITSGGRRL